MLFEGSPSRSANRNAVEKLKSHSSMSPDSLFSSHQLQILLFGDSISLNAFCKCAMGKVWVLRFLRSCPSD